MLYFVAKASNSSSLSFMSFSMFVTASTNSWRVRIGGISDRKQKAASKEGEGRGQETDLLSVPAKGRFDLSNRSLDQNAAHKTEASAVSGELLEGGDDEALEGVPRPQQARDRGQKQRIRRGR